MALGVIGFIGGYLEKNLSKDSKITVMIMVGAATAGFETFLYLYRCAALSGSIEFGLFFKKLLLEVLYNVLLVIIVYPMMQRLRL